MIDLHNHLLPGLDDGPATLDEALGMARAFVAAGITTAVATPHVRWDHPANRADVIAGATATMCAALADAGIDLELRAGAEINLAYVGDLSADELDALSLGGGGWLLVEPPFSPDLGGVERVLDSLLLDGRRLLLAHPERSPALASDPERLRPYVDAGVRCQITAGSLTGGFGRTVHRAAVRMLEEDLAHIVSTDAHSADQRGPAALGPSLEVLGDEDLARWLTVDGPQAILDGEPLPERPAGAAPSPRGLLTRLRGRRR